MMASQEDLPEMYDKVPCETCLDCPKQSIYFNDGTRSVDFVLVWDSFNEKSSNAQAHSKRKVFEQNLMKEGLELEYEPPLNNGLNFVKVKIINLFGDLLS